MSFLVEKQTLTTSVKTALEEHVQDAVMKIVTICRKTQGRELSFPLQSFKDPSSPSCFLPTCGWDRDKPTQALHFKITKSQLKGPPRLSNKSTISAFFFLKIFWKEGEKHQCVVASQAPPTGDLDRNPGMYSDWECNQQT